MKAMRLCRNKNRIMTVILSFGCIITSVSGCGLDSKGYDAPELVSPVAVSRIFRKPEIRDMKSVRYYEGVVVPTDYPAFYDRIIRIDNIKVKIGDYVEKGDVIAEGDIVGAGDSADISQSLETNKSLSVIQNRISDDEIEIEEYNKKEASENKDEAGVKMAEMNIELLKEDKRYDEEMSGYEKNKDLKAEESYNSELGYSRLIADHSGYVTFLKDISVNDTAMPYENVVVISDMDDLYIEGRNSDAARSEVRGFEEQYTYIDGRKVDISEIEYPQEALSLAEVSGYQLPLRFKVNSELKAGDNMLLIFKNTEVRDTLTVGAGAVDHEGLDSYVYVRKNGDDIEKKSVEVGFDDGRYVEILYGINEDDEICYPLGEYYPTSIKETEVKTGEIITTEESFSILGKNTNVKGYYTDFPGKIEDIKVGLNQKVNKGDLLFTYKTENTKAKLTELEASINTLKKNHNEIIKMLEEMKSNIDDGQEINRQIQELKMRPDPDATMTDAVPEDQSIPEGKSEDYTPKEPKFVKEKTKLNQSIVENRIKMENLSFNLQLSRLEKQYEAISRNNNGDGLVSVYAEKNGVVKRIDLDVTREKLLKERTYVLSVVDEGYNETLIQMRKKNTSAFGVVVEDKSGTVRSADLGKELHLTINGDSFDGRVIGINGHTKPVYLAETDNGFVFTTSTPGTEYWDQFYAETDKEIDYEWALENRTKGIKIWFAGREYKGVPILDKGVIYTEYNENIPLEYVWIQENGELVKRYIITCQIEGYDGTERIVIDGVEPGDKVIRETKPKTEE